MNLYKYVTPERIDILQNLRIRFTQPTALNDPFEFRPLASGFRSPEVTSKFLAEELERRLPEELSKYDGVLTDEQKRLVPVLIEKLRLKPAMLAEATELLEDVFPTLKESLFQQLGTSLGILSLSETPTDLLMWAHYSANHSGFVFEFDDKHPWFWGKKAETDDFRHLRKVRYVEKLRSPYLAELDGYDVFYSKLKEWKYEQEWRIIRPLQDASVRLNEDVCLFEVPSECIRGVIKGIRTSGSVSEELDRILKGNPKLSHVYTSQALLSKQANAIEINRVL